MNAFSTRLTELSSNTDTTQTEKLRKLLPKGFYVFTELAAKDALENKAKVIAFSEKLSIAENTLDKTSVNLLETTIERNFYRKQSEGKDNDLKKVNRKLFFANALNYIEGAAIVLLLLL